MTKSNAPDFICLLRHVPDLDMEYAIQYISGSASLFEETLRTIIHLLPASLKELDDYVSTDLDSFRIKIHGTKSMLRQIGCTNLAKLAENLEKAAATGENQYCSEQYGVFKKKSILFYEQIIAIETKAFPENHATLGDKPNHLPESNLKDYLDLLKQAKTAAEDYDSLSAVEALLPLTKLHFAGNVDILLSKAMKMLEMYQPRQALEYIDQIHV